MLDIAGPGGVASMVLGSELFQSVLLIVVAATIVAAAAALARNMKDVHGPVQG